MWLCLLYAKSATTTIQTVTNKAENKVHEEIVLTNILFQLQTVELLKQNDDYCLGFASIYLTSIQ
jgi:hypothetical protein